VFDLAKTSKEKIILNWRYGKFGIIVMARETAIESTFYARMPHLPPQPGPGKWTVCSDFK